MSAEASRILTVTGTPFERGRQAGVALAEEIRELLICQESADSEADGMTLHEWLPEARRFLPMIEAHAPRVLEEIEGWAAGAKLPFDELLLLTCAYERFMAAKAASHCTAFAMQTPDDRVLCGQNNDEAPAFWAEGRHDRVLLHCQEDGLQTAIYTHAGIPAYMGMNNAGLCLTWMYIDNHRRQVGVPTNVLIREFLYHRDFDAALGWLRTIPHAVPNAFILAAPGQSPVLIEAAPNAVAMRRGTALTHANTVTESDILDGEPLPASCGRQGRLQDLVEANPQATVEEAKAFLLDTVHSGDHAICHDKTLASMVFEPDKVRMHIAFGPLPRGGHHVVQLDSS